MSWILMQLFMNTLINVVIRYCFQWCKHPPKNTKWCCMHVSTYLVPWTYATVNTLLTSVWKRNVSFFFPSVSTLLYLVISKKKKKNTALLGGEETQKEQVGMYTWLPDCGLFWAFFLELWRWWSRPPTGSWTKLMILSLLRDKNDNSCCRAR